MQFRHFTLAIKLHWKINDNQITGEAAEGVPALKKKRLVVGRLLGLSHFSILSRAAYS